MDENLKTVADVVRWVQQEGYAVSRASVFNHVRAGKLKPAKDGSFPLATVKRYAARYLLKAGDAEARADEKLQARKLLAQTKLIEENLRIAELERLHSEEGWIKKEDFELEVCARAAVIQVTFSAMTELKCGSWIALVGGDPKKEKELIFAMNDAIEDALSEMASDKEFHVLFQADSGDQHE